VATAVCACAAEPLRWDGGVGGDGGPGTGADGAADGGARADAGWDVQAITRDVAVDSALNPDAACAAVSAEATVDRLPVDIIWIVDNSVSMAPAIDQVTRGLNAFAATIGSRGLDYRVVMLSLRSATNPVTIHGGTRYAVCIPQPLAGDAACGNGERFFQSSIDVRSTQPLEQLLGTLGQTTGYTGADDRGGEPWRAFLRPEATKTIVVVTDDNSRLSADDFEHFGGGTNPNNTSLQLPPGVLQPAWAGLFDHYVFDGIYGWGDASGGRCTYAGGGLPPSAGPVYSELVTRTGGVRAQICSGATAWTPFFDSVATAVEHTSRVACDMPIPSPAPGYVLDPTHVNVVFTPMGSPPSYLGKVAGAGACGPTGGWYYDDDAAPTRIFLCPASCQSLQDAAHMTGGASVQVQFGCDTIPG
jgi:hypothetical protein